MMKSKMLALLTMGAMLEGSFGNGGSGISGIDLAELRRIQEANTKKYLANKKLKRYSQQGVTVFALNDKNGYRKLNKALEILNAPE